MKTGTILHRLFRVMKPSWKAMLLALVCALFQVFFTLLIPVYTGYVVDQLIGTGQVNFTNIVPLLLQMGGFTLIVVISQWGLTRSLNAISYSMIHRLRALCMQTIERMPMAAIDSKQQGDFISRTIHDVEIISEGLIQGLPQIFTGILTVLGTLFFMFRINHSITLFVLVCTPISMVVAAIIARKSYSRFKEQSAARGALTSYMDEFLENPLLVRVFSYQKSAQLKFEEMDQNLYNSGQKAQFYSSLTNPSTRLVNNLLYTIISIMGAFIAISGGLSIGSLSAFLVYSTQYMKPFNEISGVVTELQNAMASCERVFHLIDEPQEKSDILADILQNPKGEITFDDVAFSYQKDKPFIENYNLEIDAGKLFAIVGPTGCGKTTLINLIMRFYDVDKGAITIDRQNIMTLTRSSVRQSIGMVLQDAWLFAGTIRENLVYGKPDASDAEIAEVCRKTYLHDFIMRLENGYDTLISEEDTGISQGQKQLICLARVMLMDPPILILDEATSNIDTRTEKMIQKTIDQMMLGKTSIIIAHRLSTIEKADKIVVMKDGRIVEIGQHNELLKKQGFYHKIYQAQFETKQ